MSTELLAIVYGVSSAISWGTGDFAGGYACRSTKVYTVVLYSQLAGFAALLLLTLGFREPLPPLFSLGMGALAGLAGASGLVALYTALSHGRMSIVAPLSAVISALLPVGVGFVTEGLPRATTIAGCGLALFAVWLLTRTTSHEPVDMQEITLSVIAGTGFGLFFILMGHTQSSSVMWPLLAARVASVSIFLVAAILRGQQSAPAARRLPPIVAAGLLDAGGNAFFVLAARIGRVDISAVLSSLYPAATVLLAAGLLQERLRPSQWAGIGVAIAALILNRRVIRRTQ